jgi:hypothetical protein
MKTPEQLAEDIRFNLADRSGYEALDDKEVFADAAQWIAKRIAAAIAEARAEEREACAKVAEEVEVQRFNAMFGFGIPIGPTAAVAIRARGSKGGG